LPAFSPEMGYEKLSIQNGEQVAFEYKELFFKRRENIQDLIEYAFQDTYGMTIILNALKSV
jgi:hypothetical protein